MTNHRRRYRHGDTPDNQQRIDQQSIDQQSIDQQPGRNPLPGWSLLLRSLAFRRVQTAVVAGTAALIMATAVFAPWYNDLVDEAVTTEAFQSGRPGSTWHLTGPEGSDPQQLLPTTSRDLFEKPVAGRQADLLWHFPAASKPVQGGMVWRDGICQHLELTGGRCPVDSDDQPVEVAVSDVDAKRYDLHVGSKISEKGTISTPVEFAVTGIYRLKDPSEPFWFGIIPTERSGWSNDQDPLADHFVVAEDAFAVGTKRPYSNILDVRVHAPTIRAADVPTLRADTATLLIEGKRHETVLSTEMPHLLDRLERGWQVSAKSLAMIVAQIAVLACAVLAMLARVVLIQRRTEIGLGRLRGQGTRRLVRTLSAEWALVVAAGAVAGGVIGVAAVLLARARWLPSMPPLAPPWTVAAAASGTMLVTIALMIFMAGPTVREPVTGLLRSVGSRSETSGPLQLVIDVVGITAAGCGLLVGLQSPADSALVLLTPALLAVAVSVLLARLLAVSAGGLARRWMGRGRTGAALATIMLTRARGTRALLTVLCMASALAVFSTQVTAVGDRNREYRAALESGAAAVSRTAATPYDVVKALDEIDPDRESAMMVVNTHRTDASALGAMFVEPEPFQRLAFGAAEATTAVGWQSIEAPAVKPIMIKGGQLTVTVEPHALASEGAAEKAQQVDVTVDYLQPNGRIGTAALGIVPLTADQPQQLSAKINCADGCPLLRWRLNPDGPVAGSIQLSDIGTAERKGKPVSPAAQGAAEDWQLPPDDATEATARPDNATLEVTFDSGGSTVTLQHGYLPTELSVLMPSGGPTRDDGTVATVTTPGQTIMPIATHAVAEGPIPRSLTNVAVADVAGVLRRGEIPASTTSVQVWYSEKGVAGRAELDRQLAAHQIDVVPVDSLSDYRSRYAQAPESLVAQVNPAVGVLAMILAALGLVLSVSASWRVRSKDLAALRMVGVRRGVLLSAVGGLHGFIVVTTVLAGTLCGLVGYTLAIRRMPMFSEPQPAIPLDLGIDGPIALVVLGLLLVILGLISVGCGRWLMARSDLGRVREASE